MFLLTRPNQYQSEKETKLVIFTLKKQKKKSKFKTVGASQGVNAFFYSQTEKNTARDSTKRYKDPSRRFTTLRRKEERRKNIQFVFLHLVYNAFI